MYLIRGSAPSEAERDAHMAKWNEWMGKLGQEGTLLDGAPFAPTAQRVSGGLDKKVEDIDSHTPDTVGGYIMIQTNSMDEAVAISKDCPVFELPGGNLEVCKVEKM